MQILIRFFTKMNSAKHHIRGEKKIWQIRGEVQKKAARETRKKSSSRFKLLSDCCISFARTDIPNQKGSLHCRAVVVLPQLWMCLSELGCWSQLFLFQFLSHWFLADRLFCFHPISTERDMAVQSPTLWAVNGPPVPILQLLWVR